MSTPAIYADFVNHIYQLSGVPCVLSDIIQQTAPFPLGGLSNIYPGAIALSGDGLVCSGTPTNFSPVPPSGSFPCLTPAALAAINAGAGVFSVIVQYSNIQAGPGVVGLFATTPIVTFSYTNPPSNLHWIACVDYPPPPGLPSGFYVFDDATFPNTYQASDYIAPPGQNLISFAFTPPTTVDLAANTATVTTGSVSTNLASQYYFIGLGGWAQTGPSGADSQNAVSIQFIGIYTDASAPGGGGGVPPPPPPPTPAAVVSQLLNATTPTPLVAIPCCHTEAPICHCK